MNTNHLQPKGKMSGEKGGGGLKLGEWVKFYLL